MRWLKRIGRVLLLLVLVLGLLYAGLWIALRHSLPAGVAGEAADRAAHAVEAKINLAAWQATGAVKWTFDGRHHLLWDRQRNFVRVQWKGREVLLDMNTRTGRAYQGGTELAGEAAAGAVDSAIGYFYNDAFWLNPLAKLFDDGVERRLAPLEDGTSGLTVHYAGGGKTPGDTYLWMLGPDGRPRAWRLWVKILPCGGYEFSWEGWITLASGAEVATKHKSALFTINLEDVAGTQTLAQLEPGPDPFAPLVAR
jgi:hypothetical protein